VTLARVGAIKDFRGAGLKVDQARVLKECLQPGGETYNMLVISGRLKPTKVEPPNDGGNPSDGLSSSSKSQTHQTLETQLRHFCKTLACVVDTSTSQLLLAQCESAENLQVCTVCIGVVEVHHANISALQSTDQSWELGRSWAPSLASTGAEH
jgi:hypothetical protein